MGEGKTSLILPMLAVALGRPQKSICRIFVLSGLEATNRRDLRHVLGGCLNRRVYSFPFARDTVLNTSKLRVELEDCLRFGGVILTIPEHVLSFQLNALVESSSSRDLLSVLDWTRNKCKDVLDECDEILHPKFQLVYTIGTSQAENPIRWSAAFCALHVVRAHTSQLFSQFPHSMELITDDLVLGLRLTENEAYDEDNNKLWDEICRLVVDAVLSKQVEACAPLPLALQGKAELARRFVLQDELVSAAGEFTPAVLETLLVLRGLLTFEVLRFVLSRRWKVHFGNGPHPKRLAVPYKAKDVPSPRSDFAHQDSAICFSILHYTYNSLTLSEFKLCLKHLVERDDAERQFERWTSDPAAISSRQDSLPITLAALNLKDDMFVRSLHRDLGKNAHVVEFYLSFVVFPNDCKSYSKKISASPWNLSPPLNAKNRVIGFSGSVDSKLIYPAETNQHLTDASSGMVVLNLLGSNGSGDKIHHLPLGFDCAHFFQVLRDTGSLIFLDVAALTSASITNEEFARMWLKADDRKQACVFPRDSDGTFCVATRHSNRLDILAHSPYATLLGDAFVFLDQFRTRGVDLKFAPTANGVVTISRNTTRDACCQAAMRLRLLGSGQKVHFLLSPEVGSDLTSKADVVSFCFKQTQREIRDATIHWQAQGTSFVRGQVVEKELCDLQSMYQKARGVELVRTASRRSAQLVLPVTKGPEWEELVGLRLDRLLPTFARMGGTSMDEEQEREFEVERVVEKIEERRVERPRLRGSKPPRLSAVATALSRGEVDLERYGDRVLLDVCLQNTMAASMRFKTSVLFATNDFVDAVRLAQGERNDSFVRQVEWVAVSRNLQREYEFTVLSPYEANALLFSFYKLSAESHVALFQFAARVRRIQQSSLFDDARLVLPVGSWMAAPAAATPNPWQSLALFSGQLFFPEGEAQLEQQYGGRRRAVELLLQMRWNGIVGNVFAGSDIERWISKA